MALVGASRRHRAIPSTTRRQARVTAVVPADIAEAHVSDLQLLLRPKAVIKGTQRIAAEQAGG
jgi:hypothetical protein